MAAGGSSCSPGISDTVRIRWLRSGIEGNLVVLNLCNGRGIPPLASPRAKS
jgi:hypothetical protein